MDEIKEEAGRCDTAGGAGAPSDVRRPNGGSPHTSDSEKYRGTGAKSVDAGRDGARADRETDRSKLEPSSEQIYTVVDARAILRLALLFMLLASVGAAGGFAAAGYLDKVYAARSEIAFDLRGLDWDSSERFLETQTVIARSRTVLSPIGTALGIPVQELEGRFQVEKIGASSVVRLQYSDKSASLALDVVGALTNRYLAELRAFGGRESTGHWVLTPAFLLEAPIAPQPLRAAALGALAGFLVGVALLFIRAVVRQPR
jgi:capsular polysaccharide biosynthesis protein